MLLEESTFAGLIVHKFVTEHSSNPEIDHGDFVTNKPLGLPKSCLNGVKERFELRLSAIGDLLIVL